MSGRNLNTQLNLEALEVREVPAVVASVMSETISGRTESYLQVQGDSSANNIVVKEVNGRLSVEGLKISVNGKAQNDILSTSVKTIRVYGGDGNDRIVLSGVSGNAFQQSLSRLFYGLVDGGKGNDVIYGTGASDYLFGNEGHDRLLGGNGVDALDGGKGNDGLFGGGSTGDSLQGGEGNDRFWHTHNTDTLLDVYANDVAMFLSSDASESKSGKAMGWTDRDIEILDQACLTLQNATGGSTRVFKNTYGSQDIHYLKEADMGSAFGSNGARMHNGQALRTIHLRDWDENNDTDNRNAMTTFIHELMHNFDSTTERTKAGVASSTWTDFLALSGWTQTKPANMTGWARSGDGQWYYKTSSAFAPEFIANKYSNPHEDFTETAELYFDLKLQGKTPATEHPALAAKFKALETLLNALR